MVLTPVQFWQLPLEMRLAKIDDIASGESCDGECSCDAPFTKCPECRAREAMNDISETVNSHGDGIQRAQDAEDDKMEILRPAADIIRSISYALSRGQLMRARKLSEIGIKQHPDHPELRNMARILAPPRIVRTFKAGEE